MSYLQHLQHERQAIVKDAHEGLVGGHYACKVTMHKIMCVGLWWKAIFHDTKNWYKIF